MKKTSLIFTTLILASIAFISSCTKDTTPPSMNFKGGTGYTSADVTIPAGTELKIGINAQSGSSKLTSFAIKSTFNNITDPLWDTTFSTDTFNRDFYITVPNVGDTRLTFTVTDKDGQTDELAFVVTVTAVNDINTYTEVLLGSYDNSSYGSSFASADGSVYMMADAKANAAKVDWLYYYGVTNLATLAAPDDASAATIFNGATNGLPTWTVRNPTRFSLVSGGAVWDNILTSADIAALATNTTETKVNQLQVGDIVAFKTASNKLGLLKISDITGTSAGTIKYDAKVQK
jgi:hypothetical protein